MLTIRLRGKTYHADFTRGHEHLVRGSLGTRNRATAVLLRDSLETAIVQGQHSEKWKELSRVLPVETFARFAKFVGLEQTPLATLDDLRKQWDAEWCKKIKRLELQESTRRNYNRRFVKFEQFLVDKKKSTLLKDITLEIAGEFKEWYIPKMCQNPRSRGGIWYADVANDLRMIFARAVDNGSILKNPFPFHREPKPKRGTRPFSADELVSLRKHAGDDYLTFLFFRWTGFRRSDAFDARWQELLFDAKQMHRFAIKNRKELFLPMSPELVSVLKEEYKRRNPQPDDRILLNHRGNPFTSGTLFNYMRALGERAGVRNVHPHRFRSTFAVDLLLRGVPLLSVARILGDTVKVVVDHYLPYVNEFKEHALLTLSSEQGIEQFATQRRHSQHRPHHGKGRQRVA
jgi:integrase